MKGNNQKGVTLLELTVVLLILIALAGLAIPYIGGTSRKVLCDATDVSMANIKKAIMDRYYLDTLGYFPKDTKDKTDLTDYSLEYLMTKPTEWSVFDPDSQVGWRGPYVQGGMVLDSTNEGVLLANFKSLTYTNKVLADGQTIILDSWGRPMILQVTTCSNWDITAVSGDCARLVSAGFGGGISLANGDIDTQILDDSGTATVQEQHRQNDDRILYLNAPTPAVDINPSCGD